jgi:hypothetical protein
MSPAASAQSPGLQPLLLALSDLPAGYSDSPSAILGNIAEFNSAVPANVPVATAVFYDSDNLSSYDEPAYFGVSVAESLGEAGSSSQAVSLSGQLTAVNAGCNPGSLVDLPGTPSGTVARMVTITTQTADSTYAIAYATKGPYVLQMTWGTSQLVDGKTAFEIPTPSRMGQQLSAALAHLPS